MSFWVSDCVRGISLCSDANVVRDFAALPYVALYQVHKKANNLHADRKSFVQLPAIISRSFNFCMRVIHVVYAACSDVGCGRCQQGKGYVATIYFEVIRIAHPPPRLLFPWC